MDRKKKIILASSSPRRRQLMAEAGIPFEIDVSDVEESADGLPEEMVAALAERKARAVAERREEGVVVGADTLVALDGHALGKPKDDEEARLMLRSLSGRTHDVFTGVCVIDAKTGKTQTTTVRSGVTFRRLSEAEIEDYIAMGEHRDKAGAYAIQGMGGRFVAGFEGSKTNIIGLPMERLAELLDEMAD